MGGGNRGQPPSVRGNGMLELESRVVLGHFNDPVDIEPGQIILDTYDGQQYTVKQELSHNSIHPMHRYLVEGVKKA